MALEIEDRRSDSPYVGRVSLDVVHQLGYDDQPHLARSLTRFIGRTATQLRTQSIPEPLSLLYKTEA